MPRPSTCDVQSGCTLYAEWKLQCQVSMSTMLTVVQRALALTTVRDGSDGSWGVLCMCVLRDAFYSSLNGRIARVCVCVFENVFDRVWIEGEREEKREGERE